MQAALTAAASRQSARTRAAQSADEDEEEQQVVASQRPCRTSAAGERGEPRGRRASRRTGRSAHNAAGIPNAGEQLEVRMCSTRNGLKPNASPQTARRVVAPLVSVNASPCAAIAHSG